MEAGTEFRSHRLGELFCGPGGLGLGAKLASVQIDNVQLKIEHAWATDSDPDSCETYKNNLVPDSPSRVVCADIRELRLEELNEIDGIEGLSFGFPCNDYSVVGERKGIDGDYGPLYRYGIEALSFFKPLWFVAENVGGLKNTNEGKVFQHILSELIDTGYNITPHLYRFEQYGVPQARHRIIIVGIRTDQSVEFQVPSPEPYRKTDVSVKTALTKPPIAEDASNNEFTNHDDRVVERLMHIEPGQNAFNANLPDHLKLNVKGAKISQIYKRLEPDKPAYTVTGSGGGGTHVYHWSEDRALTNRERARLQTFPDEFVFAGKKESVRRQIGMAVPPRGAAVIFEAILKSFSSLDYHFVESNLPFSPRLFEYRSIYEANG